MEVVEIGVCVRWLESFDNFLADMGERPGGKTLDRIDSDGDYEPDNCRWVDQVEQNRHMRGELHRDAKLTNDDIPVIRARVASGESYSSVGREYGVNYTTIVRVSRRVTWKHVA